MTGKAHISVSVMLAAVLMFGAAAGGEILKPRVQLADVKPKLNLQALVPSNFSGWRELKEVTPVLPDPTVQAVLDATYSQTLARTYVNDSGQHVMLTIAYGSDQNSEATAAHRPEFCYTGAGFRVQEHGTHAIDLGGHSLTVRQLIGVRENRIEPISYWVTLDESATLPGIGRKLAQIRYGLNGQIADGMLIRVSTIDADVEAAYAVHDQFIQELRSHLPKSFRARFFGAGS